MSSKSDDDDIIEPGPAHASNAPDQGDEVAPIVQPGGAPDIIIIQDAADAVVGDIPSANAPATAPDEDPDEEPVDIAAESARIYLEVAAFQVAERERLAKMTPSELEADESDHDHPINVAYRESMARTRTSAPAPPAHLPSNTNPQETIDLNELDTGSDGEVPTLSTAMDAPSGTVVPEPGDSIPATSPVVDTPPAQMASNPGQIPNPSTSSSIPIQTGPIEIIVLDDSEDEN